MPGNSISLYESPISIFKESHSLTILWLCLNHDLLQIQICLRLSEHWIILELSTCLSEIVVVEQHQIMEVWFKQATVNRHLWTPSWTVDFLFFDIQISWLETFVDTAFSQMTSPQDERWNVNDSTPVGITCQSQIWVWMSFWLSISTPSHHFWTDKIPEEYHFSLFQL